MLFRSNPAVLAATLPLLAWVALFHSADAVQTSAAFVLRAWHITTLPMLVFVAALWGVGLGGGYTLAFGWGDAAPGGGMGAQGFWIAATAGLTVTAVLLTALLAWVLRQHPDAGIKPPTPPSGPSAVRPAA